MADKLKATYAEKNIKDKSLTFRLCSPCFNYICSETKAIFEKLYIGDESPVRKSNLSRPLIARVTSFSPSSKDQKEFSFQRRESHSNLRDEPQSNSATFGRYLLPNSIPRSMVMDELSESLLDFDLRRDNPSPTSRDLGNDQDDVDFSQVYKALFPELIHYSEVMVSNVMNKVGCSDAVPQGTPRHRSVIQLRSVHCSGRPGQDLRLRQRNHEPG